MGSIEFEDTEREVVGRYYRRGKQRIQQLKPRNDIETLEGNAQRRSMCAYRTAGCRVSKNNERNGKGLYPRDMDMNSVKNQKKGNVTVYNQPSEGGELYSNED